jgi:hypothetical protein
MVPPFRELTTRRKVLAIGGGALLVVGLAAGTFAAARSSNGSSLPRTGNGNEVGAPTQQLPGAHRWNNGVSSYIFGTNDTVEYGWPNVDTLPSVQADLKAGGLTLMRTWAYPLGDGATVEQRVKTIENAGMTCMMMLGGTGSTWLKWMQSVVTELGSSCNIYEFGNEPSNIGQYTNQWIKAIPALRAINPHAVFGGPAIAGPTYYDGSAGNYPSDLAYFLAKTKAARVPPSFVSWHDYPCNGYTSQSACLTHTPEAFAQDQSETLAWEQQYLGYTVPTGVSEYNFDAGSGTLDKWANDAQFMYRWTRTAIDAFAANHFSFAAQFTSLNWSGYGKLDMFSDSAPNGPKSQYYGIVASVQKYGGPSTLAIPNPLP